MPRYVILFHKTPTGYARAAHWDLMLETGDTLRTWALDQEPRADVEIAAEQLADHRPLYLDYEGPVAGDRGTVTRWCAGNYTMLKYSDDAMLVHVEGSKLAGTLALRLVDAAAHRWTVRFVADRGATDPTRDRSSP